MLEKLDYKALLEDVMRPTPVIWQENITTDGKWFNKAELNTKDEVICITQHMDDTNEVYFTISELEEILAAAKKFNH